MAGSGPLGLAVALFMCASASRKSEQLVVLTPREAESLRGPVLEEQAPAAPVSRQQRRAAERKAAKKASA